MPSTDLTHTHCSFFERGLVVLLAGRRGAREAVKVEWKVVHAVGQAHALGVEQWVARYAGQLWEVWWERTVDRARDWGHAWRTKDAVFGLLLLWLLLRWGGWLAARAGPARLGGGGTRTSNLSKNSEFRRNIFLVLTLGRFCLNTMYCETIQSGQVMF